MPKFYLYVTDGKKTYQDSNGLDVNGASAAEALRTIRANDLRADAIPRSCYVDVRDQQGNQVAKVFVVPRH